MRRLSRGLFFAFLGTFLLLNSAHAVTFTVSKTADTDDGTCDADCSLREAITAANSASSGDTIVFDETAFLAPRKTIPLSGIQLPDIEARGSLRITAPAAGVVINADNRSRVFFVNGANVTLTRLSISNGNAQSSNENGGGILNSGTLVVQGCTFSGNRAVDGGAVYSSTNLNGTTLTLRNCTISGNTASNQGGALFNFNGLSIIESSTLAGNSATVGTSGGVASFGDSGTRTQVNNSIIASNTGGDVDFVTGTDNSFQSGSYNLIGTGGGAAQFTTATHDQVGVTDPKLGPLQDNGGQVLTRRLLSGSPAIDAANSSLGTDQLSTTRPFDVAAVVNAQGGNGSDIGAFELNSNTPVDGTISPATAVNAPGQARSFVATYSDADGVADLNLVALRVGGSDQNSANSLLCLYNVETDRLSIFNDGATALIGSAAPGTDAVLSNSQGSLNCKNVSVTKDGNTLTINWNVSATGAFAGTRQPTFLFARDTRNLIDGYEAVGSWTISGNARPVDVSVSPVNVSDAPGVERFFTTTFSDPNGYKNLQFVTLRLGGSGTGSTTNNANTMLCVYNVQNNKLYLFNNAGVYVPQADFPGRATVLQNSQGSLDCSRTTVTGSGNTLTVKWSVKAKAAFVGSRSIALLCADRANLRDGYDTFGTWTIAASSAGVPARSEVSTAKAAGNSIMLAFTGPAPQSGYAVTNNGVPVQVAGASVKGSKVELSLSEPLYAGHTIVVTWSGGSVTLIAS